MMHRNKACGYQRGEVPGRGNCKCIVSEVTVFFEIARKPVCLEQKELALEDDFAKTAGARSHGALDTAMSLWLLLCDRSMLVGVICSDVLATPSICNGRCRVA